jgi:hypothetical protein
MHVSHLNLLLSVLKLSSMMTGPWVGTGVGTVVLVGMGMGMGVGGIAVGCSMAVGGMAMGAAVGAVPVLMEQLRDRIRMTTSRTN